MTLRYNIHRIKHLFPMFIMTMLIIFIVLFHDKPMVYAQDAAIYGSQPVIPSQDIFRNNAQTAQEKIEESLNNTNEEVYKINYNNVSNAALEENIKKYTDKHAKDKAVYIAELAKLPPRYSKGDYYVITNPDVVWTVVKVEKGLIYWRSDKGGEQVTYQNPILPVLEWKSESKGRGKRVLSSRQGAVFPLGVGNEFSFLSSVTTDRSPYRWQVKWQCVIDEALHNYRSSVGTTTVYRINCGREQNINPEVSFLYAPVVGYYVAMELLDAQNNIIVRRELRDYGNNALAYLQQELLQTPIEFNDQKSFNNSLVQKSEEEISPVINLTNIISNAYNEKTATGERRGKRFVVPETSPKFPEITSRRNDLSVTVDSRIYLDNLLKNQEKTNNSPLDNTAIIPLATINGFQERAVVPSTLPNATIPDFEQGVYDLSVDNVSQNQQTPSYLAKQYQESLPKRPSDQAVALLRKRFGDRLNDTEFFDQDEELNVKVGKRVVTGDDIHKYYQLPPAPSFPNRYVEANNDDTLQAPVTLEDVISLKDSISNEEFFTRTNPEYKQIDSIDTIESQRISEHYKPKSLAQTSDQLAFVRTPIDDTWSDISSRQEKDLNTIYNLESLRAKAQQERKQRNKTQAKKYIGEQDEDLLYQQTNPTRRLVISENDQPTSQKILELALARSKKEAAEIWQDTLQNNKEVLAGLQPSTQRVAIDNQGIFYKLLAVGPMSDIAAHQRCSILLSRQNSCKVSQY